MSLALLRRDWIHDPVTAFLDLEDLKAVSDEFGHGVGDQLPRTAADRLTSLL